MQFYLFKFVLNYITWIDDTRHTACQQKKHARVIFGMQLESFERLITSKLEWKLKHTNSILEYFEYFCHVLSESILIILSYAVSKLMRFVRHSVYVTVCSRVSGISWLRWLHGRMTQLEKTAVST